MAFVKAVAQLKQYKLHLWRYNASLNVKEIKITPIARFFLNVETKKVIKIYIVRRKKIGDKLLCSVCNISLRTRGQSAKTARHAH